MVCLLEINGVFYYATGLIFDKSSLALVCRWIRRKKSESKLSYLIKRCSPNNGSAGGSSVRVSDLEPCQIFLNADTKSQYKNEFVLSIKE